MIGLYMVDSKGNSVDASTITFPTTDQEIEPFFREYFQTWSDSMIGLFKCLRAGGKNFEEAYNETLTAISNNT